MPRSATAIDGKDSSVGLDVVVTFLTQSPGGTRLVSMRPVRDPEMELTDDSRA